VGRPTKKDPFTQLQSKEATAVLRELLQRHPELQSETEAIAGKAIEDVSVEEVAEDASGRVLGIGLDELNGRAGGHSWGYVEPSEAAWELLEESIEDVVEDMKRRMKAGCESAAEKTCIGLVIGLFKLRHAQNDGALGWAPDFPAEAAEQAISDFIELFPKNRKCGAGQRILRELRPRAAEWMEMFERVVHESSS
jgi:hypothetical protein